MHKIDLLGAYNLITNSTWECLFRPELSMTLFDKLRSVSTAKPS